MDPCSSFLHPANTKAENIEWDCRLKHHEMHTIWTYVIYIYQPYYLSNKSRNEYESSIKKGICSRFEVDTFIKHLIPVI
jgi:hypothetical protein